MRTLKAAFLTNASLPDSRHRLLRSLSWVLAAGLAACGGGGGTGSAGDIAQPGKMAMAPQLAPLSSEPASTPLPSSYTVVNLGWNAWGELKSVNASGQVAFNEWTGTTYAVRFRNGSTTQDIDTSPITAGLPSYSYVRELNDAGQAIGRSHGEATSWYDKAWSWTPTSATTGTLSVLAPTAYYSYPIALNSAGEVVGHSSFGTFAWNASSGFRLLPSMTPGAGVGVSSINANGVVAGQTWTGSMWTAATWTPTGTSTWSIDALSTPADRYSWSGSINSSGVSAGAVYNPYCCAYEASVWNASGRTALAPLPGDLYSYAYAISDSGHVIGQSWGGSYGRTVVWSASADGSSVVELGDAAANKPAYSWGQLNKFGHVAGYAHDGTKLYGQYAFVWSATEGLIDLNTRITGAPPGLHVYHVYSIGDGGHILAYSTAGLVLLVPGVPSSAAPSIGPIAANDPLPIGSPATVSANFTDTDTADSHTASWSWGDGSSTTAGTVTESGGSGTATGSHTFTAAGVYQVSLTITDSTGRTATVRRDVVVYDPSAGFVTGGGWIMSPAGAYKQDQNLAGRATFAFVSKYLKGANTPTGKTEFQFHAAKLNFFSDNYEWLVVAGARAQYKGSGTINGQGNYKFLLTAVDGQVAGGGGTDRFRIKIWHYDTDAQADVVDYDNQLDTSTEGTASEGTVIGGGSIRIHK